MLFHTKSSPNRPKHLSRPNPSIQSFFTSTSRKKATETEGVEARSKTRLRLGVGRSRSALPLGSPGGTREPNRLGTTDRVLAPGSVRVRIAPFGVRPGAPIVANIVPSSDARSP